MKWIEDLLTKPEWKIIFKKPTAIMCINDITGASYQENGYAVVKMSTNLNKNKCEAYFTNGKRKRFMKIDAFVINYPELTPILDEYEIKYLL